MVYCSFDNIAILNSNMRIEYIQFYLGSLKLHLCVCSVFGCFVCLLWFNEGGCKFSYLSFAGLIKAHKSFLRKDICHHLLKPGRV